VNISKNEQFEPSFLKISPNNRIPAIVDTEGPGGRPYSCFESGAILIYLAEKTGKFRPKDADVWTDHLQWLMWQMGGFGPMLGQAHHFLRAAPEKVPFPSIGNDGAFCVAVAIESASDSAISRLG